MSRFQGAWLRPFDSRRISSFAIFLVLLISFAAVTPRLAAQTNEWTWMNGSNQPNAQADYGTLGTPAPGNTPGGLQGASGWVDSNGNFWLFGGYNSLWHPEGINQTSEGTWNDLWEFMPSTGEWVCIEKGDGVGNFGTLGTAAPGNLPPPRSDAAIWRDLDGNFWLFGGYFIFWVGEYEQGDAYGYLNDLWRYSPSTGEWTWMGGSQNLNDPGAYGTLGTPSSAGYPSGRSGAAAWIDSKGNFWLFGGGGQFPNNGPGFAADDLWEYQPSTGNWTWVSGSDPSNPPATPPAGIPAAQSDAATWTDAGGNFWLFGNGFWELSPSTAVWTEISLDGQAGYGTLGVPGGVPEPRASAYTWTDASGNFWLFGGGQSNDAGSIDSLNDLWRYTPSDGLWTWMGGSQSQNTSGVYGPLGVSGSGYNPGARYDGTSWTDPSGNFWLFGGVLDVTAGGYWNDVWMFTPPPTAPAVATPTFTPPGGTYSSIQNVHISTTTDNATIYYTTDGSVPTTSSSVYSEPIVTLTAKTTISAIALASGYIPSAEATAIYTVNAPAPVFTPPAGSYASVQSVQISTATPDATIYYTTDGSTPTTSSGIYDGPISIGQTETIKAMVTATGYSAPSAVVSATYIIRTAPTITWPTPAPISYGTKLSSTQLDATASVPGTFAYSPAAGTVLPYGSQKLSATFTPSDTADYTSITVSVNIAVNKTTPTATLTSSATAADVPEAITLTATVSSPAGTPTGSVTFYNGTTQLGVAALSKGTATYTTSALTTAGSYRISAQYTGDANFADAFSNTVAYIIRTAPTITWPTPAPISYGTKLSSTQLDATASVPGTFAYSPAAGTVLPYGSQKLSATFTPSDTADYTSITVSVNIAVNKTTPTATLTSSATAADVPEAITLTATVSSPAGTPTGSVTFYNGTTQLGVAALSKGTATYTTSALTTAGSYRISAQYTGDANFADAFSNTVAINVSAFGISSGGSTSATISPGGTATYKLTVTPPGDNPVSLSVTGQPVGATSTFNPDSVPAGGPTTTVTLSIAVPSQSSATSPDRPGRPARMPLALGLLLLPLIGLRRLRKGYGALLVLLLGIAGAAGLATLNGCGGGGSHGGGGGTQQTQTYNLTVRATAGSATQTTALTLTVE